MPLNPTIAPTESASDAALLIAFANTADSRAFTSLVQRYHGLVQGAARRILGNDASASDIAQEVFVRFSREAHRVRPDALGAWLHRASVRGALNELRASQRRLNRESAAMNTHPSDSLPAPLVAEAERARGESLWRSTGGTRSAGLADGGGERNSLSLMVAQILSTP